ncbi:MAG: LPS assembly protein LptD [Candidatus Binatia bacterium]
MDFNRPTSETRALGDAVLISPDADVHAEAMFLDLDDETGELHEATVKSTPLGFTISGQRIEKGAGQRYHIENGRFTTCNCSQGAPDWSIAGDRIDVELDDYGRLEGGTFNILDVPVLWLPHAAFPAVRERQTGLLIPRVGFSNRRGFQTLQPVYWAIDKTQDATFSFDIETAIRVGLITEYRYALSPETSGAFKVGYFNEFFRGATTGVIAPPGVNTNTPENRWGLIGNHSQRLAGTDGPVAYADLLLVGDDLFLREMNTFTRDQPLAVALRTLPFTTSQVGLLQEWKRAMLQGTATYYQDLIGPTVEKLAQDQSCDDPPCVIQFQDESLVIQRLPDVRFTAQQQLGLGLMTDFTGSLTNFQRTLGLAGVRADLKPSVELALPLGRSLFGSVRLTGRETAYGLSQNQMAGGFTGQNLVDGPFIDLPSGSSRELFEVHTAVGTQLGRVFDFPYFGLDKIRHVIEPQVEYLYIPAINQDDLPVFDGIDRINQRDLFTYGFATRLLGRYATTEDGKKGEVFELMRLSVAQSADVLRSIPPTSALNPVTGQPTNPGDKGDHFSDVDVSLRINPNPTTSLRTFTTYDTSNGNISSTAIGIHLTEPFRSLDPKAPQRLWTRASFRAEYRFITDGILQQVITSTTLPLTDRFAVRYSMRYDIDSATFLGNYVGMRLLSSCDCWALNIGVHETHNPNEVQLQAQFSLGGFGAPITRGFEAY